MFGVLAIALMVVFPPWLFVYDYPGQSQVRFGEPAYRSARFAGYHAIMGANRPMDGSYLQSVFGLNQNPELRYFSMRIDKDRLWLQFAGVLAVALILTLLLKTRE